MTSTDTTLLEQPRFCGIPTFMRMPQASAPDHFDIGLVGVPYDGALTVRPGARFGPRELRNASCMTRAINHATGVNPFARCRVADLGDVPFSSLFDVPQAHAQIRQFLRPFFAAGKKLVIAGGDHSITYPILQAIEPAEPLGLIHIDAHTDTWDQFAGSKFSHGSPFRRAVEDGLIDPKRSVQIGIRGAQNTEEGWRYSLDQGMRVLFIEDVQTLGIPAVIEQARRVVGDGPTYLSFDVDAIDPAFAPGTGTPEIGGLSTREALQLLRGLRGLNLVSADVVEVSPPYDPSGNTALVGATLMYEQLCLLAEAPRATS
ncbi:MAG: Guanidinopropionase [Paracidovorax wautersii]|uniref:Guanidinopropionase n=1 Tax=Paracidovorax wautersii TaxID=1177982 RepID=A0A7V8FNT4_9BURK|nr:MAG: Guanidinopropionase [Paracidovorax wautersii]